MPKLSEFEQYINHLCEVLGHQDRHAGFADYSRGLMLPIERKSVEPLAAHTDPLHVSSQHQSLHHLVAMSEWSDTAVLERVRDWVMARLGQKSRFYWIVDDTGFPKKGEHSIGVARQYCGQLGKQDNCQVAVSLSLATEQGSVPIEFRLYLPEKWAKDRRRRKKAGVPKEVKFLTKPEIALEQIRAAKAGGVGVGIVLADAAYGNDTSWREELSEMELEYCVGVQSVTTVWSKGTGPLPPMPRKKMGRPPTRWRRGAGAKPVSVKELAESLPARRWRTVEWREGTNTKLSSRFAALRVRAAHRDEGHRALRQEQWLLIEWPGSQTEPTKYWLSTLPVDTALVELVRVAKMRWRIERDYQELKQEFGLSHYEGRGWRGFHHHATLCIAAYGFLLADRLKHGGCKKNSTQSKTPSLPADYTPRGSPTRATSRARLHRHAALHSGVGHYHRTPSMSLRQRDESALITQ
ncbi:MAG TPA: IS701 family transposase [Candidatus Binatia bacterium]|nr:IS701 family transposase [Candidatus Binatia bacterium]